MTTCILMIVAMYSGPPDFKCVPIETCRRLEVMLWVGREISVTRGQTGRLVSVARNNSRLQTFDNVKTIDCFPEHTGAQFDGHQITRQRLRR